MTDYIKNPEDYYSELPGTVFLTALDDSKTLMSKIIEIKDKPSEAFTELFLDLNRIIPKINELLKTDEERVKGSFESLIYNLKYCLSEKERESCITVIVNYLNFVTSCSKNNLEYYSTLKYLPVKTSVLRNLYFKIQKELQIK